MPKGDMSSTCLLKILDGMSNYLPVLCILLLGGATKENSTLKELRLVYYRMSLTVPPDTSPKPSLKLC